jgi:hypothetical protein
MAEITNAIQTKNRVSKVVFNENCMYGLEGGLW